MEVIDAQVHVWEKAHSGRLWVESNRLPAGAAAQRYDVPVATYPPYLLPDLLALARYPNVAVKLSAAPTLSREPFPFRDLWPPLHQILDAFGPDRLMWGSDWTRVVRFLTYREGVVFITETSELSPSDKEQLLGATLRKIPRWPKPEPRAAQAARPDVSAADSLG